MAVRVSFWKEIVHTTPGLPFPVFQETETVPKQVVLLRIHDNSTSICTSSKILIWYCNHHGMRSYHRAIRGNESHPVSWLRQTLGADD